MNTHPTPRTSLTPQEMAEVERKEKTHREYLETYGLDDPEDFTDPLGLLDYTPTEGVYTAAAPNPIRTLPQPSTSTSPRTSTHPQPSTRTSLTAEEMVKVEKVEQAHREFLNTYGLAEEDNFTDPLGLLT